MRPDDDDNDTPDVNTQLPQRLDQFVGQTAVVESVRVALQACRNSGSSYPSSLFTGSAGLGKSQLASIIAHEMDVTLKETLAQTLTTTADLQALLLEAQHRDIVFIDEADELPTQMQTLLYRALAERKLFVGRGRSTRQGIAMPLDDFCLIMATNHESRLQRPLVERFKIVNRFEFYTEAEVERLLSDRATALRWSCEAEIFPHIAARSRGVPRVGLRLLEAVHRVGVSEDMRLLTRRHVERACAIEGIDAKGLDRTERKYLRILDAEGAAIRPTALADKLGVPLRTLQSVIEPFLIRQNLVSRSEQGRTLTTEGLRYVMEMAGE